METMVSKGFLIYAENSKSVNYIDQAYALALSIKYSQHTVNSVSIMTNDKLSKKQQAVFDQVVEIPWSEENTESRYKSEHRWKLFHVSPYEETIVLDADMLLIDDISNWWSYCNNFDIKFCSKVTNYKLEMIKEDTVHRRAFIDNKLTNPYFACHYFKKSEQAYNFYKVLEFVCNNWEWCYDKFAPVSYQNWSSMDLIAAIAIEITGYYESVIDEFCPMEFVHMKIPLQHWPIIPNTWQDAVPYVLNSKGDLVVGNIKQSKLFHYVEKSFLSKKIILKLEELANGKKRTF